MARLPVARTLTNIGTTAPTARPLTERAPRFLPGGAAPIALPVAEREGEGTGQQAVSAEPLWISRWQPSATDPRRPRPWVKAFRWYVAGAVYPSLGKIDYYRIDLMFIDGHKHAYIVPEAVWREFRGLATSVGQWLHNRILKGGASTTDFAI